MKDLFIKIKNGFYYIYDGLYLIFSFILNNPEVNSRIYLSAIVTSLLSVIIFAALIIGINAHEIKDRLLYYRQNSIENIHKIYNEESFIINQYFSQINKNDLTVFSSDPYIQNVFVLDKNFIPIYTYPPNSTELFLIYPDIKYILQNVKENDNLFIVTNIKTCSWLVDQLPCVSFIYVLKNGYVIVYYGTNLNLYRSFTTTGDNAFLSYTITFFYRSLSNYYISPSLSRISGFDPSTIPLFLDCYNKPAMKTTNFSLFLFGGNVLLVRIEQIDFSKLMYTTNNPSLFLIAILNLNNYFPIFIVMFIIYTLLNCMIFSIVYKLLIKDKK